MQSFADLIRRWPSVVELAADLGVSRNTAAGWLRRESIPSDYWATLLDKASARGIEVSADDLIRLAAKAA